MYDEIVIPPGLDAVVIALCADFSRRAEAIALGNLPYNVIMEYRFLNYRIMNAAVEIAGSRDAKLFIKDIGGNIGYADSELWILSERAYKRRKKEVKDNIARRLSLI